MEGPAIRRASGVTVFLAIVTDHESMEHRYCVYLVASKSPTLYVAVTSDLKTRIRVHRTGIDGGFTAQSKVYRLVYYERFQWVQRPSAEKSS